MCGIVGLYLKNPALESQLGKLFEPMLLAMTDRGPDSAGFAIYGDEVADGWVKLTLQSVDASYDWKALMGALEAAWAARWTGSRTPAPRCSRSPPRRPRCVPRSPSWPRRCAS